MRRISQRVLEFLERLSFTPTERNVVISLVGAFLVGLGIQFFRSTGTDLPVFDYTAVDSEFNSKSAARPKGSGREGISRASTHDRDTTNRRAAPGSIHINSADKRELMTLPGIGDAIADRILRYRMDHGQFTSVRDLLKVKGIGKKKLEHLAPFCVVEN